MKKIFLLLFLILYPCTAPAGMLIGGEAEYTVKKGDTLEMIGAKFGTNWRGIVKLNHIDLRKKLKPGTVLLVNNLRIVPKMVDNGIIINIPDRMLYFFKDGSLVMAFPVGLGKPPKKGEKNWETPLGDFVVVEKEKDPSWHVPESIQAEMEAEGEDVKKIVPPGDDNPLGRYALRTSMPAVLIHETIWPGSVYQFRSHGCIRVTARDMEKFFPRVEIETSGELIYVPVKVAIADRGKVFLEVQRDVYRKFRDLKTEAIEQLKKLGVSDKVDWNKVYRMIREKSGIAEDVTS